MQLYEIFGVRAKTIVESSRNQFRKLIAKRNRDLIVTIFNKKIVLNVLKELSFFFFIIRNRYGLIHASVATEFKEKINCYTRTRNPPFPG